ncbi:hypothetical protein [Paludisphaera rhizosphaerae]|uniref:hypothetical protein n=1 Tax=Paludisphaera rhizosphaerae TaxID=2711216 RepID=UPI0013EBB725|nr:hypothetical protein [Paludisphaera rhizosphaerae]
MVATASAALAATAPAPRWNFEADPLGGPAKGFTTGVGRWVVEERDGSKVLAQQAANDDPVFNVALVDETSYQEVDVSLRVKADAGEFDQGGGVVWRAKDKDNYYVARYNPLENNFRMYLVENGRRTQLDHADAPGDKNWHTIRITAKGKQIAGWLDGVRLLTATDRTFLGAGKVGVWSKADARSFFDDLTATEVSP